MSRRLALLSITMIAALSLLTAGMTKISYKALPFENPGTKRMYKTESTRIWHYRSLPEKTMRLRVKDMDAIRITAIGSKEVSKPSFTIIINKTKTTYNLVKESNKGIVLYKPTDLTLPKGTESLELLCYDNSIYFRAFRIVTKTIKTKPVPALQITQHDGVAKVLSNSHSTDYYYFDGNSALKFNLNNNRKVSLYVRAQLVRKSVPVFEIYRNGTLVDRYELSTKRTGKYTVEGIKHLTVGKKIVLTGDSHTTYEIRAVSDHKFLAHPSLIKE